MPSVRLPRYFENTMATYTFLFGVVIGLVAGLAICYFKQIKTVVQNKDKISSIANVIDAATGVKDAFSNP